MKKISHLSSLSCKKPFVDILNTEPTKCHRVLGNLTFKTTSVPFSSGRRTRIYSREGTHLVTTTTDASFLGPISWRSSSLLSVMFQIMIAIQLEFKPFMRFLYFWYTNCISGINVMNFLSLKTHLVEKSTDALEVVQGVFN